MIPSKNQASYVRTPNIITKIRKATSLFQTFYLLIDKDNEMTAKSTEIKTPPAAIESEVRTFDLKKTMKRAKLKLGYFFIPGAATTPSD